VYRSKCKCNFIKLNKNGEEIIRKLSNLFQLFQIERIFSVLFNKCSRSELVCDTCEFAKYTITMYPSLDNRSLNCFDIIHSDVWRPHIAWASGFRWFVTFIDCCSRVTWLFLIRSKSEVPDYFWNFHKMLETQSWYI
jgi:hypothetical protein